jgi:hypothetical protein
VLLTACGTVADHASPSPKADKPTPLKSLTLVSAKTSAARTAKLAFTVTTRLAGGQAQTVSGQGVDAIMLGTTMYMRVPGQEPELGKPWLKLDLAALSKASGADLGNLTQDAGNDPPSGAAGSVTVRTTMEMFDFGTTVTVARPPASQVSDFTHLVPGGVPATG